MLQDIVFNEKFGFCVDESQTFLNVCVMCRQAARQDRQRKLTLPERHVVLAHVGVSFLSCRVRLVGVILMFNVVVSEGWLFLRGGYFRGVAIPDGWQFQEYVRQTYH